MNESTQIKRIKKFEKLFDSVKTALEDRSAANDLSLLCQKAAELEKYYTGRLWKKDFSDDEKGLLPKSLKRGVLSEDGVYDLFLKVREKLEIKYDLLIKNGKIVDGTGGPSYNADIAIKDGKIVRIGKRLGEAKETLDAAGLVVTPGFIDSHSHSDASVLPIPEQREKVEQGITTCICGQCGSSTAPLAVDAKPEQYKDYGGNIGNEFYRRKTLDGFLDFAKDIPQGCSVVMLMGHGTLRRSVMGLENREPTPDELEEMKKRVRLAMEHGALGMSFGLFYSPGCYAKTDECIALAKIVGEYGGVITSHIRDEGEFLVKAVNEFITIAKESGCRAVISHHKVHGVPELWGKVSHTLRLIDKANEEGYNVWCDVYPYTASATTLGAVLLPKESHTVASPVLAKKMRDPEYREYIKNFMLDKFGEDYSWIQTTSGNPYPDCLGMTIPEIAEKQGKTQVDAAIDVMRDSDLKVSGAFFTMCEEDVRTVIKHPRAMICTDSSNAGAAAYYHPRLRATFPRILGEYVRNQKLTTLPEMIRKITSMPARVYGLKTKGLIWENFDADICIFDENKIKDNATYKQTNLRASGLSYVVVGGNIVVRDAVSNGEKHGKVVICEHK